MIDYLRKNALTEEGIFRVVGSHNRLQSLKEDLIKLYNSINAENKEVLMSTLLQDYCVNDVTGVFKYFIRELPEPLLSLNYMEGFLIIPSN